MPCLGREGPAEQQCWGSVALAPVFFPPDSRPGSPLPPAPRQLGGSHCENLCLLGGTKDHSCDSHLLVARVCAGPSQGAVCDWLEELPSVDKKT